MKRSNLPPRLAKGLARRTLQVIGDLASHALAVAQAGYQYEGRRGRRYRHNLNLVRKALGPIFVGKLVSYPGTKHEICMLLSWDVEQRRGTPCLFISVLPFAFKEAGLATSMVDRGVGRAWLTKHALERLQQRFAVRSGRDFDMGPVLDEVGAAMVSLYVWAVSAHKAASDAGLPREAMAVELTAHVGTRSGGLLIAIVNPAVARIEVVTYLAANQLRPDQRVEATADPIGEGTDILADGGKLPRVFVKEQL